VAETAPWPTDIAVVEGGRILRIAFDTGGRFEISAELLRVESPSAEVKGHGPGQETLQWGKRDVTITGATGVGNYAIRLSFSDGHDSGIYTWSYLAKLGSEGEQLLMRHAEKLAAAGLRR
jgi:DUF971 family protein